MVAPCGLDLYIFISFMDHVQTKNHNYQPQDEKNKLMVFCPHVHSSSTTTKHLSWKILKPKCDNKNYRKLCQTFKLENEMKQKIKWITFPTFFI